MWASFFVLRCMHCNLVLALRTIAWLAEAGWDAICVERFSFHYKRSKLLLIPPVPEVTRKSADITGVTEGVASNIIHSCL